MAHEITWLKKDYILFVDYRGHQTPDTLLAALDEMEGYFDESANQVLCLISWFNVTGQEPKTLRSHQGHRAYSHPNVAQAILVGFSQTESFENEIAAQKTRGVKHTVYFKTMDDGVNYLRKFHADMLDPRTLNTEKTDSES